MGILDQTRREPCRHNFFSPVASSTAQIGQYSASHVRPEARRQAFQAPISPWFIDELYVGVDASARQFVIPVQAKRAKNFLGDIQTIQDAEFRSTHAKYKHCLVRQVSAQFLPEGTIALFELDWNGQDVTVIQEQHYKLVPAAEISDEDLLRYRETRQRALERK